MTAATTETFLAVDGGQTGTVALLAAGDGTILGVGHGGPVRHHEEPGAEGLVHDALVAAVTGALSGASVRGAVAVCCLSMTGSSAIAERVVGELVPAERYVVLDSDTFAALASGTAGGGGIALIAGTGTASLASGRSGQHVRLGGWGWLLGDEGGGFWIALRSLRAAARHVDGTGPATILASELPSLIGQRDMRGVYDLMTGSRLDRTAIASLTPRIVAIAEDGDGVAAAILDSAADRLTGLALATISAAPFLAPDEHVVVGCGGVLRPGGWVADRFVRQVLERAPGFRVVTPAVPPVVGAFYLALRERGIGVDDALREHVEAQVRSRPTLASKTPAVARAASPT